MRVKIQWVDVAFSFVVFMSSLCGVQGNVGQGKSCAYIESGNLPGLDMMACPWASSKRVLRCPAPVPCPGVASGASLGVIIGPVARVKSMLPLPASHKWLCGQ